MTTSIIGGSFFSISHAGVDIFKEKITSGIGGIVIDLVTAAIPPGEYTMELESGIGGIEIYLPTYAKFTISGTSVLGGADVHEGLGFWGALTHKVKDKLHLTSQIPEHAVAPEDPSKPVKITFKITRGAGGVDIYRLTPG
jgi:hypothetical protein